MKYVCLCLYLLSASVAFSQAKKSAPASATASPLARICQDPFQVREPAEGWPEAPVRVLFHREKSKAPWSANPAIRLAGLEAATAAGAKTLVCVEESQIEMGHYDSGEPAYAPSWSVTLVRISDRKVYSIGRSLSGGMPPDIKWQKGAGVGRLPTDIFVRWMRLVLDQKVARLKMRLKSKAYDRVSAMAFSGDGAKLAVAQEPYRSGSDPNPPSPISVFDLANGQPGVLMHTDYSVTEMALSKSGSTIATERYGHVEIWDAASGNVTQKLETKKVGSLLFGPGDTLGVAGDETAQVWDVAGNRVVHSAVGSEVQLSPEDAWMAISSSKDGVKVRDLESGRELSAFPRVGERDQYAVSRDGRAMARYNVRDAFLYLPGNPQAQSLELPNLSYDMPTAVAATRDGFVIGNSDGFVGVVSGAAPKPRAFAAGFVGIKALAVSSDGKLIAVGDSGGSIEIWELR
jgi:WD40 repeat protein